jgi:hypothetical protein
MTFTDPMPIPEFDSDDDEETLCGYELVNRGEGFEVSHA